MSYTYHQVWLLLGRNSVHLVSGNRAGFVSKKGWFPLSKPQDEGDEVHCAQSPWCAPQEKCKCRGVCVCVSAQVHVRASGYVSVWVDVLGECVSRCVCQRVTK